MTIQELQIRRTLCDAFIRELINMEDPRALDALEHYKNQLAELDAQLTQMQKAERERLGLPEPEPIVVGVKPAIIFGNTKE